MHGRSILRCNTLTLFAIVSVDRKLDMKPPKIGLKDRLHVPRSEYSILLRELRSKFELLDCSQKYIQTNWLVIVRGSL